MGKSSSQVVGYRYYAKFAAFIGNRIEKLIAINFDNRKWLTRRPGESEPNLAVFAPNLYGENEGGVDGLIDVFIGTPNQQPSEVYQKYFPLVSGYPCQSYLIFRGGGDDSPVSGGGFYGGVANAIGMPNSSSFYLGNSGYMKEMLLWVKRTRVRNDGRAQWYEVRGDGAVVCEIGAYIAKESLALSDSDETGSLDFKVSQNRDGAKSEYYFNYSGRGAVSDLLCDVGTTSFGGGRESEPGKHSYTDFKTSNPNLVGARLLITIEFQNYSESFGLDTSVKGAYILNSKRTNYGRTGFGNDKEVIIQEYDVVVREPENPLDIFEVGAQTSVTGNRLRVDGENYIFGSAVQILITRAEGKGFSIPDAQAPDINPIHKIREILTDDTAMGKPESDINDENFIKAADRIFDEGLGISWAIDEKSCIEAVEELCYHIEAGIRVNRQTGLYEMILFRDNWFVEDEIHTMAENKIKDLSLEIMNSDDIVNQLNVTYYDRERIKNSTFSIYENGSILTMGHANAESVEFPYFMNMRNAEIVANWKLKQFSTPAWSGSFTTGWREARKWNRYDLIRLPWSKKWNGTILVRIMKINLGDGVNNTVTIDFEEVIPYSGEMNTSIVVDNPVDSGPKPPQPSVNAVFEAPYYLTVLRAGQTNADLELSNNPDVGYVAAIAAKSQNNSLNALLFTDGGTTEFEQVSRLDYCDILQLDQPIIETSSSFIITGSLTQTANSNNLILLNDEWMGFIGFDNETKVLTVERGVLDTVPKKHSSGSLFVFDLPDVAFDSTQYAQGEVIEAQVLTTTPSGIQDLLATGTPVEIHARAIRPYPPANVKINGEYYPQDIETDLILTWVDRNRLQQTGGIPLSWFDNGVAIEQGTQTHLILTQLDENQIELATNSANVSGANTFTFPISSMQAEARTVEIVLKTIRDGYECYQPFVHTVELSMFFSEPYNFTAEFRND